MQRSSSHRWPVASAVFLAAALVAAPLIAPPVSAAGGALERPVPPSVPGIEEDWELVSALDLVTLQEQCPGCPLPGGLDHVANGGGARNEGHAAIRLRGAEANSVPVAATLYVGVIDQEPPPVITVGFDGHPVAAGLIGTSAEPCWSPDGVYALYRADVLSFVPPWINGDYDVSGIPTLRNDGGDPWAVLGGSLPMAEGASLVVVYSNAKVPPHSTVYTHEGPSTLLGGALSLFLQLSPPLPGDQFLRHTRLGGDGQVGSGVTPDPGTAGETTFINGNQIKGPGAPANQDSDWNGADGVPLNQLWDTQTSDVTGTMSAGDASYVVDYFSPGDCISPSVHVLTAF